MSKPNYDDLIRKKDKPPIKSKLAPQTEPIKLETNKKQPPKQPPISSSPSRNKLYQHVAPRVQSKLPVSVHQKKSTDNSGITKTRVNTNTSKQNNESNVHDKSSLLSTDITSLQPSLSSSSLTSTTSSDDEEELNRLNEMLERFRTAKETSPTYLNKQILYSKTNKEDKSEQESDDETSKANEIDIENLKNRLNNLREKLFKNHDYAETNGDSDREVIASIQLDALHKDRPPIQPKSTKQTSKQPILLETNKFNSSTKVRTSIPNINIESIDFKAKQLIEKSESSLSEKAVSSDGLGSSRSTSSMMSTLSSNFQETQPYKPEFLKYLENKNKIGTSSETGEILKPEEDILYQWRLRRKLEEAKKLAPIPEPVIFESVPVKKLSTAQSQETQSPPAKQQTLITPTKQSMQTQTVCDSAVQTSLDLIGLSSTNSSQTKTEKKSEKLNEIETQTDFCEKPTRDVNHLDSELLINKNKEVQNEPPVTKLKIKPDHIERPKKSNFSSSSPIRSKSKYLIETNDFNSLKNVNNLSADLTRVSSINEITTTHVPKTSNSPIIFNPSKTLKKPQANSVASSNLYSVSTASMTVVTASTDSKSNRISPTNMDQTILISSETSNRKMNEIQSSDSSNNFSVKDEYNYIQSEMIESDEILRILLKKNYFYRLKLKQIDELLTK